MAEVDTIDIPDVTPVTRTVATMSKLIKTTGVPTDAKSTATDATSVTWMQVIKQVSFSIQAAAASLATLVGSLASLGPAAMTSSQSVTLATDDARIGPVNETAPASDTASAGINGRSQRIAQRITSLIALFPAALGSGGGIKVDDIFGQYEIVAAGVTAQAMGATGATGDYLAYVIVFPGTAGCGVVTILDNATAWGTFVGGGTTALPSLVPFRIDVGAYSVSGAWKITTGTNVTAVGVGKFT